MVRNPGGEVPSRRQAAAKRGRTAARALAAGRRGRRASSGVRTARRNGRAADNIPPVSGADSTAPPSSDPVVREPAGITPLVPGPLPIVVRVRSVRPDGSTFVPGLPTPTLMWMTPARGMMRSSLSRGPMLPAPAPARCKAALRATSDHPGPRAGRAVRSALSPSLSLRLLPHLRQQVLSKRGLAAPTAQSRPKSVLGAPTAQGRLRKRWLSPPSQRAGPPGMEKPRQSAGASRVRAQFYSRRMRLPR